MTLKQEVHLKTPFYFWEHKGYGERPVDNIFKSEIRHLENFQEALPTPDSLYEFQLAKDLYAYFPIAISYQHSESHKLKNLIKETNKVKFKPLYCADLSIGFIDNKAYLQIYESTRL